MVLSLLLWAGKILLIFLKKKKIELSNFGSITFGIFFNPMGIDI